MNGSRPCTNDEAKNAESGILPDSTPKEGGLLQGLYKSAVVIPLITRNYYRINNKKI